MAHHRGKHDDASAAIREPCIEHNTCSVTCMPHPKSRHNPLAVAALCKALRCHHRLCACRCGPCMAVKHMQCWQAWMVRSTRPCVHATCMQKSWVCQRASSLNGRISTRCLGLLAFWVQQRLRLPATQPSRKTTDADEVKKPKEMNSSGGKPQKAEVKGHPMNGQTQVRSGKQRFCGTCRLQVMQAYATLHSSNVYSSKRVTTGWDLVWR